MQVVIFSPVILGAISKVSVMEALADQYILNPYGNQKFVQYTLNHKDYIGALIERV